LNKSRGTPGAPTAITSSDGIGSVRFRAYDGTQFHSGATIDVGSEVNWDASTRKAYISFSTTDAGLGERMRITSVGNVGIGTTAPDDLLHIAGTALGGNLTMKIQNLGGVPGANSELLLSTSNTLTNTSVGASILADR